MPVTDTKQTGLDPLPPENSRSNPLPGEQITLTDDERTRKYTELSTLWGEAAWPDADVAQRKRDWAEYNCTERPSARKWPLMTADGQAHSANIKFPLLRRYVDAWTAQVTESVFAERPLIAVHPSVEDGDPERSERVEQRFDNVYESLLKYPRMADKWIRRTAVEGTGVLHIPYRKRERFLLQRAESGTGVQEGEFSTIYDAPKPEVIPLDRFRLYPNNVETIDDAWGVFYQYKLPLSELEKGRKPSKGNDGETIPAKYILTDEQWALVCKGTEGAETTVAEEKAPDVKLHTRVDAVDVYCRYEYVKGQPPLPVVFTFLPDFNGVLIRATPCSTGDVRPFVVMRSRECGNGILGLSMNRVIDQIVESINVQWNQMDNQVRLRHLLANTPFYSPGLGADLNKPFLGAPVACLDPAGIRWLDVGADMEAMPRIEFLLNQLEASIGVNANALGVQLPSQRTATEINSLVTQGSRIFREQIELMNCAHVEAAELICWQYYLNGPAETQYLAKPNKQELASTTVGPDQNMPQGQPMDLSGGMPMEQGPSGVPGDMGAMGAQPSPPPPQWITRSLRAEDFAPGLVFTVRGSGAHMNRAQEVQEALQTREAFMQDPLVLAEASRLWTLDSNVLTAQRHPDPEAVLGPKQDEGVSVMQLMAQSAPPQPEPPQPPPADTGPKMSISVAYADLPPDAQAALLEGLGLPGDDAAEGYRDQLEAAKAHYQTMTRPTPQAPGAKNGTGRFATTEGVETNG